MFFKRLSKTKPAPGPDQPPETARAGSAASAASAGARALTATELSRRVEAKELGFKTTAELEPANGLAGQERALAALDFGLGMTARDFNIIVVGPPAAGKRTALAAYLSKVAAASQTPPDWVYVSAFDEPRRARALALPPGRAPALAQGLRTALTELAATLPAAFQSEDYLARRRAIDEEAAAARDDKLEAVQAKAARQNIAVLRTPRGFAMAPMHEGKVVKADVFNQLPEGMRRDVEARIGVLQEELERVLAEAAGADKQRRRQRAALDAEVARPVIEDALDLLSAAFGDVSEVTQFLAEVEKDLIRHAGLFAAPAAEEVPAHAEIDPALDPRLRRYLVNVMVTRAGDDAGAPVCTGAEVSPAALAGYVAHEPGAHGPAADFLTIRPGAMHQANGGALMLDARRLLEQPAARDVLRRQLAGGEIRIGAGVPAPAGAAAPATLEPDPIPLMVKVLLVGEPETVQALTQADPDLVSLFKVRAELDEALLRSKDNDRLFARLVTQIIDTHDLNPMDAAGVAQLMDEAARLAEDRDKVSLELGRIADIVREADYWAGAAGRKLTTGEDVARALRERKRRAERAREHVREQVTRGTVLVETAGSRVGQVNALSLVQKGGQSFGRPARITARVSVGQGRLTDIEREVALGGPLHSKGVLVLAGFLAGRFAQDVPLALSATLVFEQSYDAVDGDSAAAAELIALISALADVPLRQDIGVTGSVNQWGEVQPVGGVNEKVEGFFDISAARGLTGSQGVIIPDANRQNLMLGEEVAAAVRDGRFAVYAVKTIDEALALLTGLEAGTAGADGRFGAETVNGRAAARLKTFAETARRFAVPVGGAATALAGRA